MKNYAEMSDFEINKMAALVLGESPFISQCINFGCGESSVPVGFGNCMRNVDYCNNWADAGPVILENRISLFLADGSIACAYSKNVYDEFGCVEGYEFEVEHKNPLRAAMIVFLMMKDNETRILAPDEVSDE